MKHVVIGAGPIGMAAARHLAGRGDEVVLACRSGRASGLARSTGNPHVEPAHDSVGSIDGSTGDSRDGHYGRDVAPAIDVVPVDATDADALTRLALGADTLVNAVNPPQYHRWPQLWPPMATAFLAAAERTGAAYLLVGNLYGYGATDQVMTADLPLRPTSVNGEIRARMWAEALAAHDAGRLRAAEVRASDYVGPTGLKGSVLTQQVISRVAAGKRAWLVTGRPDVPHTWTVIDDIGATVAALATARGDRSQTAEPARPTGTDDVWGRPWLVPSNPPVSMREVAAEVATLVGGEVPRVSVAPGVVKAALRAVPTMRAIAAMEYQFTAPFRIDASDTESRLGVHPTVWEEALRRTVVALGHEAAAPAHL